MTPIGIAIVERDGCYLVGMRGPDGPLPGVAEFPGGKCRPDESPAACAIRECAEETGLPVAIVRLLLRREYAYPHGTLDLHFFLCTPVAAEAECAPHNGFAWVPLTQLRDLTFPPANDVVLAQLLGEATA